MQVLDIVVVNPKVAVTNLGNGVVIDADEQQRLVRFEHGPAKGIWYHVGNLTKIGSVLDYENLHQKG